MDENLLTWNFPNFVTIILMIVTLWVIAGLVGHFLFRAPAQQQPQQQQGA